MVEDEADRIWPKMNGKQVFRWATRRMPEVSKAVLSRCGYTTKDIDLMIPHQANMRINQLVAASLYLEPEQVVHNIERYGNTTAASIPLALSETIGEGKAKEGSLILFAAFGAGFTWGAALVRL
jgi:3-oxoacyl-[acyl-carrier-protein] synthase-3